MTIVVGGHTRNVGKTRVTCQIIEATPEVRWTAIKISRHGHGAHIDTPVIEEERIPSKETDTGRYLAAGAARSVWVRARPGHTLSALEQIGGNDWIIESTSVLDVLSPDLFVLVISPENTDWKQSALRHRRRADHIVQAPMPEEVVSAVRRICVGSRL